MIYKSKEQLFEDFKKKEIEHIDAIQVLMDQFQMTGKEAESLVEDWES